MRLQAPTQDSGTLINVPQLLMDLIDQNWVKYKSECELCRYEFSSDAIRAVRIATRRMLALVQLLDRLNLGANLRNIRCALKDQLDGFDSLRDTQVVLTEISGTIQEIPDLLSFQEFLQKTEKRLLRTIKKKFRQIKPGESIKRIVKKSEIFNPEEMENITVRMLHTVDEAFLITLQRVSWVRPFEAATIHSVRLAFKKFRYLVEMIHPALGNFPQVNLKHMKDYQGAMGRIQDIEILLVILANFASSESTFDPEPAFSFFKQRHTDAITEYMVDMHDLNHFWRDAPDHPFPWENAQ